MAVDCYTMGDVKNVLQAVSTAHGPMGEEAARVLAAVADAFAIPRDALRVECAPDPSTVRSLRLGAGRQERGGL